jgi:hypothetical protein
MPIFMLLYFNKKEEYRMGIEDKAIDLFGASTEAVAPIACELILQGVAGTIAPGVVNVLLAYQQKRQERMYGIFMEQMKEDIGKINGNLSRLNDVSLLNFKDKYFGMISDYVLEEVQEEKIKFLETGFVRLSGQNDTNEDFVLLYYDTLLSTRLLDLEVLDFYYKGFVHNTLDFIERKGIEIEQFRSIREKLERLGLLTTNKEEMKEYLYKDIFMMQEYLTAISKEKKYSLKGFKTSGKLKATETFKLSKFGRNFLEFFSRDIAEI